MESSTKIYLANQEKIGSIHSKDDVEDISVVDRIEEYQKDSQKLSDFLCEFTGRWYDEKTVQTIIDIFQDAKPSDANKKKRKLDDEVEDICPPQKKQKQQPSRLDGE